MVAAMYGIVIRGILIAIALLQVSAVYVPYGELPQGSPNPGLPLPPGVHLMEDIFTNGKLTDIEADVTAANQSITVQAWRETDCGMFMLERQWVLTPKSTGNQRLKLDGCHAVDANTSMAVKIPGDAQPPVESAARNYTTWYSSELDAVVGNSKAFTGFRATAWLSIVYRVHKGSAPLGCHKSTTSASTSSTTPSTPATTSPTPVTTTSTSPTPATTSPTSATTSLTSPTTSPTPVTTATTLPTPVTTATTSPTPATTSPTPATTSPTSPTTSPTPATSPTPVTTATTSPTPATTSPTPVTTTTTSPTPATTATTSPTPATTSPTTATTATTSPTPVTTTLTSLTPATTSPTPATKSPTTATTSPTPATSATTSSMQVTTASSMAETTTTSSPTTTTSLPATTTSSPATTTSSSTRTTSSPTTAPTSPTNGTKSYGELHHNKTMYIREKGTGFVRLIHKVEKSGNLTAIRAHFASDATVAVQVWQLNYGMGSLASFQLKWQVWYKPTNTSGDVQQIPMGKEVAVERDKTFFGIMSPLGEPCPIPSIALDKGVSTWELNFGFLADDSGAAPEGEDDSPEEDGASRRGMRRRRRAAGQATKDGEDEIESPEIGFIRSRMDASYSLQYDVVEESTGENNQGILIGAVVGGVVAAITVAALVAAIFVRRKGAGKDKTQSSPPEDSVSEEWSCESDSTSHSSATEYAIIGSIAGSCNRPSDLPFPMFPPLREDASPRPSTPNENDGSPARVSFKSSSSGSTVFQNSSPKDTAPQWPHSSAFAVGLPFRFEIATSAWNSVSAKLARHRSRRLPHYLRRQ